VLHLGRPNTFLSLELHQVESAIDELKETHFRRRAQNSKGVPGAKFAREVYAESPEREGVTERAGVHPFF
jgi:hypothetical protein